MAFGEQVKCVFTEGWTEGGGGGSGNVKTNALVSVDHKML
jgi:hypothetical protein